MVLRKKCPICMSDDKKIIFYRDFTGMNELVPYRKYNVVRCNSCKMLYAGDLHENMSLEAYYKSISKYESKNYRISDSISKYYDRLSKYILDNIDQQATILDVGCAFGGLLNTLKKHGYSNLTGLEPSRDNCNYAKDNYNIEVKQGFIGDGKLRKDKYELIILSAVLEHVADLHNCINEITSMLTPDGKICIVVPDANTFYLNRDLYQEYSTEHINYFTIDSLKKLFSMHNFSCVSYTVDKEFFSGLAGNIFSIWCRDKGIFENNVVVEDNIELYMNVCDEMAGRFKNIMEHNNTIIESGLYVWCAGTLTAMLFQIGILNNRNVKGIFDSNLNYQNHIIYDYMIYSPEKLKSMPNLPILIASQQAQKAIMKQINEWGLTNKVITLFD